MSKRELTGVLLEVDKLYDFGGGPIAFSREALCNMAKQFNRGVRKYDATLTMEDDKLVCRVSFPPGGWEGLELIPSVTIGPLVG